jgi:hypothetical protein
MNRSRVRSAVTLAGLGGLLALCVTAGAIGASAAGASSGGGSTYGAAATFTGPVTTGKIIEPLTAQPQTLAANGYVEQEYFAAGTATAFKGTSEPSNGRWSIAPASKASYRTRIIVRRPQNPARFNGTVVVEWMNVSAGESAPDWDFLNPELMKEGYAYVAVSAQALAVDGGKPILGSATASSNTGLVGAEPARYGSLHHPGDKYSLDMFAQIGQAVRTNRTILGPLHPKHVIAVGESQSAFYLTTYADALQPRTHTFDGIFIHSRGGSGASLSGTSISSSAGPKNLRIRTDLDVPVFMFETQTDLIELGYAPAQQPNTKLIRTWEVAGTSHADAFVVGAAASALGCTTAVNSGPQHLVVQAAFAAFDRWVNTGAQPPSPPPFRLSSSNPPALALDKFGNVIGGVRTPAVAVPVSTLSGAAPAGASALCSLFGSTVPFSPAMLVDLYQTKSAFVASWTKSLDQAIKQGFVLKADRAGVLAQAQSVSFPA